MLAEMTPQQFNEVMAYDSIEPIGDERLIELIKIGFATLAAGTVSKEDGSHFEPDDFDPLPRKKRKPPVASPNQQVAMFRSMIPQQVPDGVSR